MLHAPGQSVSLDYLKQTTCNPKSRQPTVFAAEQSLLQSWLRIILDLISVYISRHCGRSSHCRCKGLQISPTNAPFIDILLVLSSGLLWTREHSIGNTKSACLSNHEPISSPSDDRCRITQIPAPIAFSIQSLSTVPLPNHSSARCLP